LLQIPKGPFPLFSGTHKLKNDYDKAEDHWQGQKNVNHPRGNPVWVCPFCAKLQTIILERHVNDGIDLQHQSACEDSRDDADSKKYVADSLSITSGFDAHFHYLRLYF
jgi:hypothetical protein